MKLLDETLQVSIVHLPVGCGMRRGLLLWLFQAPVPTFFSHSIVFVALYEERSRPMMIVALALLAPGVPAVFEEDQMQP